MSIHQSFEGSFQVWSYAVGHGQLLLRRTKSAEHPARVDILLKNVTWMCMPVGFSNLEVREIDPSEVEAIVSVSENYRGGDQRMFSLLGSDSRGYVLAGAIAFHEDDLGYDDPSALLE